MVIQVPGTGTSTLPRVISATSGPQLIARDLHQSFRLGRRRIEVLRGISMDVSRGEAVFLCGASGAGKTTLLYTLAGLERPQSGTVEFAGQRLYTGRSSVQARLRNRKMGFVFQGYFLLPELTALENVMLPAMIGAKTRQEAAQSGLAAVGLQDRMNHLPAELSGGEQQRVAIARALANDPEVVFADEPTGNLDSKSSSEILHFMRDAVNTFGQTIVMVTHDPNAASYADRVVFLADGKAVDELDNPTTDAVL